MLYYLKKISDAAYQLMKNKIEYDFEALATSQNVRKENLTKVFEIHCQKLIVVGINLSFYDLNSVKPVIIQQLRKKIEFLFISLL